MSRTPTKASPGKQLLSYRDMTKIFVFDLNPASRLLVLEVDLRIIVSAMTDDPSQDREGASNLIHFAIIVCTA
jgi:hypothetical protein